jgi:hypothetical protein
MSSSQLGIMHRLILRVGNWGKACAGWLGLYVAVGGVLAFIITPIPYTDMPGCYPHYAMFGQIESNCPTHFVNVFWFVVLGLPRLAITPMALAASLVMASAKNFPEFHYLLNAIPFVAVSVPFLTLYYVSFRYWRRNDMRVAILVPLLIGAETLILGWQA